MIDTCDTTVRPIHRPLVRGHALSLLSLSLSFSHPAATSGNHPCPVYKSYLIVGDLVSLRLAYDNKDKPLINQQYNTDSGRRLRMGPRHGDKFNQTPFMVVYSVCR